ncbi:starch-binding domain-containing protein 1 [Arapaima gigas]
MSECQGKEHPFGENHSNDLKESPAALNNKHKLNSHEKQVSDGDPEKNVNEHKDFKEHLSDYDEQKELAFGLLQDHESNTNKSRRHLRQHQHHHLCDSQESSTDVCKYDVKTENKTDELTARKTGPGMNCKITMENKMKSHVIFPEYSGNHCETVSDQLEKIRDLSNVEKVDKRDKEKTGIVERDIKSHPKETWATETQKNNDTTLNPYQDVFFTGHVSNQSKHLTGCFDQEPDHKAMEVHQQIVNDQSNTKQAVDCTINTPVEENCFTMEINIMEATMNDNEWMNMNSSETENDFLAFNLKDGPDFFGSGTESKCVEDSRSVPKSLDGHVTSKGRATMQPLSQSVKVNFTVHYVTHSPFQLLAVTGSNKELGCWKNFVPLLKVNGGFWSSSIALPVDCQVEWKFVLIEDGKICRWEECCNRHLYTGHDEAISLNKCWGYI